MSVKESINKYLSNTKLISSVIALLAIAASIYFIKTSNIVIIHTNQKVKLEIGDMCLDSIKEDLELFDVDKFVPKRPKWIAIHCSGNPPRYITKSDLYKLFFVDYGWLHWGYNYFVNPDGTIITLNGIDNSPYLEYNELVNSVKGYNSVTIAIAYSGGTDKYGRAVNTMTDKQEKSIRFLCTIFQLQFKDIMIWGHRDFPNVRKECPSFHVGKMFNIKN